MADLSHLNDEDIRKIIQDEKVMLDLCKILAPAPGDSEEDIRHKVAGLRKMLELQEAEVLSQVDRELCRLRDELLCKVRRMLERKLDILSTMAQGARASAQADESAKSRSSDSLRSLLTFEVRRGEGFSCESFAYIRGSAALPQRLHFIENYEEHEYHVGSRIQMYYLSAMGCDPDLIHYITVCVSHETGKEQVQVLNCDLMNGMYLLEFSVGREGIYEARVTLYDRDISGSPQRITVQGAAVYEVPPIDVESSDAAGQDPNTVAGVTDAAMAANIRCAAASSATDLEMTKRAIAKEPQVSDLAPQGHYDELAATSASQLHSDLQQPFLQALSSVAGPSLSDTSSKIPEPPANNILSRFFTPIEPPRQLATTINSGVLNGQKSPLNGFSMDMASSSKQSSEAMLQPSHVAMNEEASSSSSSLLYGKPGSSPLNTDGGICIGEPLKPTYVVTAIAPDSSTKQSSASAKVSLPSTRKKEPVSFSGTISAKLTLEFDAYKNSKFAFPIGVTATPSGNIIIADTSQDRVVAFDPQGRALHKATFSGSSESFRRPSAVVALKDESYAVKDDRCIYVFSKNGEFIRALGKGSLCKPYGLALHGEENLFTISLGDPVPTLRCFSASGNFEQCVVYGPLVPSPPVGSKCRFMDVHDGHIFVSDLGLSCMYKTDMKGVVVSTFGTKGKDRGQMVEPSGVSATERCIFIGDSKNNRVQAFDADGKFITVVKMTSGIIRPSGIHVSERNKLYILNYLHGVVGVYDLKFNE